MQNIYREERATSVVTVIIHPNPSLLLSLSLQ